MLSPPMDMARVCRNTSDAVSTGKMEETSADTDEAFISRKVNFLRDPVPRAPPLI